MTALEQARAVLGDDVFGAAEAAGRTAPPLSDEQVTRLRAVLAQPAADQAA